MAAPEGTRLLPQPRHPFRRRAEHEAGHQNAAPPVASGAIGLRERGGEKRSLTSPGARRIRSATAATEPRRHGAPKSRIAQAKGEAFSTQIFNGEKMVLRPLLLRASLCLGCFKFWTLPTDGERTYGSSGQSEPEKEKKKITSDT